MNLSSARFPLSLPKPYISRTLVLGVIIITALAAFEMFNYSTTAYALDDLLGNLTFAGLHWATILAIAFCGIDFAGIARLFTPEQGADEPKEGWYLFGAWFLAAMMNAMLTWWGVSMAIVSHAVKSTAVLDASTLIKVVPVFVAILVWVIRILIIGTISEAGDKLFSAKGRRNSLGVNRSNHIPAAAVSSRPMGNIPVAPRPMINRSSLSSSQRGGSSRPEPTYFDPVQ